MKPNSLPKAEIVSGRLAVSALLEKGKGGTAGCLRYKWLARESAQEGDACHFDQTQCVETRACERWPQPKSPSRIMVSVPKKLFRRAVKRNLLKRRIREAYRVQKSLIGPIGLDILFVYVSKAVLPFETIYADMTAALTAIAAGPASTPCHFEPASCHSEPAEESHE